MLRCFCKKTKHSIHEIIIESVKDSFELDCIRLICILESQGKILASSRRLDVTDIESDTLLQKATAIKAQTMKLSELHNEKCNSMHIQGAHTSCSIYDLPDGTLLVLVLDSNSLTSSLTFISETRALIHAKIGEVFVKN